MEADQSDRSEGNVGEFNGSTISAPAGGSVDLRFASSILYNMCGVQVTTLDKCGSVLLRPLGWWA